MTIGRMMVLLAFAFVPFSACAVRTTDAPLRPSAAEVRSDYDAGVLFVDVRTDAEWSGGHLRSALHLPVAAVGTTAAALLPDKDRPIVTYCQAGSRAQKAAESLRALGYTRVTAMAGGFDDLEAAGFPVER